MSKSMLFSPITVGPIEFKNRLVVAPMCQFSGKNGEITDWHRMHVLQYAISGAGLFVFEATAVSKNGKISPYCLELMTDAQESLLKGLLESCRTYSDIKFGIQLNHAGRKGSATPPWIGRGRFIPEHDGGWCLYGPSALAHALSWGTPKKCDEKDLSEILNDYKNATARSDRAGFDVLEIHAAHGYLLHQFLSPLANRRDDLYGGSLENRSRFPLEVVRAVREIWPANKTLGIRISATDWHNEGLDVEEVIVFLKKVKDLGVDYVCVSSGGIRGDIAIPVDLNYQVGLAEKIKQSVGLVTRTVGMIVDPLQAEQILVQGSADQIALGRALLDDPRWVWRAAHALGVDIQYPFPYERSSPKMWPGYKHAHSTNG